MYMWLCGWGVWMADIARVREFICFHEAISVKADRADMQFQSNLSVKAVRAHMVSNKLKQLAPSDY